MKSSKKGKKIVFLIVLLALIAAVSVFGKLVFWQSSYSVPKYKFSVGLFDKIIKAQDSGGTAELTEDEVNQVISLYSKEYKSGSITVKAVQAGLEGDKIKFYIPSSYKSFNVLLTSEGSISKEKDKIKYTPDYFKVGKITLPKSYVMEKLSGRLKDRAAVEQDSVVFSTKGIPVGITALSVKDDKLLVTLEKRQIDIENMLKGQFDSLKDIVKDLNLFTKTNGGTSAGSETGKTGGGTGSTSKNETSSGNDQQDFSGVIKGLNAASGSVSTGAQKFVIAQMMSVVGNMSNSSYNPRSAEGSIRAAYGKLSPQEKSQLKSAILSNVDTSSAEMLYNMMGN